MQLREFLFLSDDKKQFFFFANMPKKALADSCFDTVSAKDDDVALFTLDAQYKFELDKQDKPKAYTLAPVG